MTTHTHDLRPFTHSHAFTDAGAGRRASALTAVTVLTFVTMIVELVAGYWSGSLALTADGWHMGTHAVALGGAALAYRLSQRANNHEAYAFGGWKIEVLSGYSSGLLLLAVALLLIYDSVRSIVTPEPVDYGQALVVAVLGLVVNLASAWLLSRGGSGHSHGHAHGHAHAPERAADYEHDHDHDDHGHAHAAGHEQAAAPVAAKPKAHDHNFSAAYLHVLADLFTSVLAVLALCGGLWFGWRLLDPAVALLGAAVIGKWSIGVLRDSAKALVDASSDPSLARQVKQAIESTDDDARVADLHVWQVGTDAYAAIVSIVADRPLTPAAYKARLAAMPELRHVTIEINPCPGATSAATRSGAV